MNPRSPLQAAANVFAKNFSSSRAFSATESHQLQNSPWPEILFTGRANVGKSLLLNTVLGRAPSNPIVISSKSAGKTKSLDFFDVGYKTHRVMLVDSPGYGARGRPEWGALWEWYIENRPQLSRIFVLVNGSHGVTSADEQVLEYLQAKCADRPAKTLVSLQAVVTKVDRMVSSKSAHADDMMAIADRLRKVAPACLAPIFTSSKSPRIGIEQLRESIVQTANYR